MSSQVNGRPTGPGGTVKDAEIAAEQRHVDRAYARLEEMRAEARRMIRRGLPAVAQAGTQGLAGRPRRDGPPGGRCGPRRSTSPTTASSSGVSTWLGGRSATSAASASAPSEHDSLVIDWRAPAAEAFYRATPEDPRGVVRRRVLHCRGRKVVDIEDDLLDPDGPRRT